MWYHFFILMSLLTATAFSQPDNSSSLYLTPSLITETASLPTTRCASVTATSLGLTGLCEDNHCSCSGIAVPPLPDVITRPSSKGCSHQDQFTSLNCPSRTEPAPIPTLGFNNSHTPFPNTTFIENPLQDDQTATRTFLPKVSSELSTLAFSSTVLSAVSLSTPILSESASFRPSSSIISISSSTSVSISSSTINPVPPSPVVPIHPVTTFQKPTSSEESLPFITSFDLAILALTSIDPTISTHTAIYISQGNYPAGLYPFIRGSTKCFFCPPGTEHGGFSLWGMNKPGIYPPPIPPPVPNVRWPTITISPGSKPTLGPFPEPKDPGDLSQSRTSKECTITTVSSCAVSCATPSGSCYIRNWATINDQIDDSSPGNRGDAGPDTSDIPASVPAKSSQTASVSSKGSSGTTPTKTSSAGATMVTSTKNVAVTTTAARNFCVPYQNPSRGESYCTCEDQSSRSFLYDKGNCPTTSQPLISTPKPTSESPKTDSSGNIWNSTDIVLGTIWDCKSTSIVRGLAPVPITKCLSSSSIGMDFTPTPAPPVSTFQPPQPTGPKKECDTCSSDMGASSCGANDLICLINECKANKHCKSCGIDCSSFRPGSLSRARDLIYERIFLSGRLKKLSERLSRRKEIQSTTLTRIRSFFKRAEHGASWKKYAPKGKKYYKILQDQPMEDTVKAKMCELDEYFKVTKGDVLVPGLKKPILEKINIVPTKSYFPIHAIGPVEGKSKAGEQKEISDFMLSISPEQGVIFANAVENGEIKVNGVITQRGIPYQLSTVVWWMWKHIVMQGQSPDTKEEETDFSNVKYFFHYDITNGETSDILKEAIGNGREPVSFTPQDDSDDNAFWPLLGSPNGNSMAWFFIDNKKSLKGKTIEKITAWFDHRKNYQLWATFV
nr:hypothetical protein SLF14_123 [Shiraia sp. slf14]